MNKLLFPLLLLIGGCTHAPAPAVAAPSVGAVKAGLSQAQANLGEAKATVEQIGGRLAAARTRAERIDGKATVILENWP